MAQQNLLAGKDQCKPRRDDAGMEWSLAGLEDWTTEAIIAKLRELGIDVDAEQFAQQAREAGGFEKLSARWLPQLPADKRETLWEDFPWMAADALWPRLAGDVICADLIERRVYHVLANLDDGEDLPDANGLPADLAAAMELIDYLEKFSPEERARQFDEFDNGRYYDYAEWLLQLVWEDGTDHPEEAMRIADVMTNCRRGAEFQGHLANVLVANGRRDDAVARTEKNLQRFGDDPWARILGGDVFAQTGDPERALRLWKEALPMIGNASTWDTMKDRLEDLLLDEARSEELNGILAAHPRPPEEKKMRGLEPIDEKPEMDLPLLPGMFGNEPIGQLERAKTVGRNDPCPCGSGKKYKKCCMP